MRIQKFKWECVSSYRTIIMGFAALIITLMHLYVDFYPDAQIPYLSILLKRGNVGVDIFLLLSGCGLFYSMEKTSEIGQFFKKRIFRVLIPYLILSIPYWFLLDVVLYPNVMQFISDVTLVSFWAQGVIHCWFVAFILLVYLVYPLIYRLQKRSSISILVLCLISIILTVLLCIYNQQYYEMVEIAITRIPVFLMGSYLGDLLRNKDSGNTKLWVFNAYFIIALIGFLLSVILSKKNQLWAGLLYRFGSGGAALLLIFLVSLVLDRTGKTIFSRTLAYFGDITFEIYIISLNLRNTVLLFGLGSSLSFGLKLLIETSIFIVSIVLSKLYISFQKHRGLLKKH